MNAQLLGYTADRPDANSYSRRICSNNSTFALQSNEFLRFGQRPNQSTRLFAGVGQNKMPNRTTSKYRNHLIRQSKNNEEIESIRARLDAEIAEGAFEKAVKFQWVPRTREHRRLKSLLARRASYAATVIWGDSCRASKRSCPRSAELAPLTSRLESLRKPKSNFRMENLHTEQRAPSNTAHAPSSRIAREQELKNFQAVCLAETGFHITRQDVARVAGYRASNAIYKWLDRGGGEERIRGALAKRPKEFVQHAVERRAGLNIKANSF